MHKYSRTSVLSVLSIVLASLSILMNIAAPYSVGTLFAKKISIQNRDNSTLLSIGVDNTSRSCIVYFPSGKQIAVTALEHGVGDPYVVVHRVDDVTSGSIVCLFPSGGIPVIQCTTVDGRVVWSSCTDPVSK